jgi:hypothetical protein
VGVCAHAPAAQADVVSVDELTGHEAGAHVVPAAICSHAPRPLQTPSLPQAEATHRAWGSAAPAATLAHVPSPLRLHALHAPQVVAPQQTLSTQLPVPHWVPTVQALPGIILRTQLTPAQ